MKLTGQVELAVVAALVGVIAFMPKLLSFIVSSAVGKAAAFAFVAWLWKQHNELVALLLAVAYLRAMPAYDEEEGGGSPDAAGYDAHGCPRHPLNSQH
jgi:hypothetical protein